MAATEPDRAYMRARLETICAALKEAVRREVGRLRSSGRPIYVQRDGKIVDLQLEEKPKPES